MLLPLHLLCPGLMTTRPCAPGAPAPVPTGSPLGDLRWRRRRAPVDEEMVALLYLMVSTGVIGPDEAAELIREAERPRH